MRALRRGDYVAGGLALVVTALVYAARRAKPSITTTPEAPHGLTDEPLPRAWVLSPVADVYSAPSDASPIVKRGLLKGTGVNVTSVIDPGVGGWVAVTVRIKLFYPLSPQTVPGFMRTDDLTFTSPSQWGT